MKLQVFTEDNIGQFFLSPYLLRRYSEQQTYLKHELFGTNIVVPLGRTDFLELEERLDEGMTFEELTNYLQGTLNYKEPENVIREWVCKGFLE